MTATIPTFLKKHSNTIVFIVGAVLLYSLVVIIVDKKLEDLEQTISVQASDQRALLLSIAETTARNGADRVTESIVRDCSVAERTRFDAQLAKLDNGLSRGELEELSRLYDRCGTFFAERKSVMVARLTREIEVYASYVDQLKTVSNKKTVERYQVATWRSLAEAEKRQSDAFTKLAALQGEIITLLGSGKAATSPEVAAILTKVKEEQQSLTVAHAQANDVKSSLLSL